MLGLAGSTWLLFRTHVTRVWWSRRALACVALATLPPLIAWSVAPFGEAHPAEIATYLGWILLLQVVTPLLALVCGSAVITEEIEDRTITYLFSRPIPRAAVLIGRWLAVVCLVSVLLGSSALLTALAASGSDAPGPQVDRGITLPLAVAAVIGGTVYSGLFASAGVFFRHPMIVGLGYAFAVEVLLGNLPGGNQALTVQHYLRSYIAATGSSSWQDVAGFAASRYETAQGALTTLGVVLLAVLLLACWRIARKEFVLSA